MQKLVKTVIIFVLGLGIGWITFGHFANAANIDIEKMVNGDIEDRSIDIEPIVTNLSDRSYARVGFTIVVSSKTGADEMEKRIFQFQNQAIKYLSEMDEITLKCEEEKLIDSLKAYLDDTLENGEVLDIFITEKVIQ